MVRGLTDQDYGSREFSVTDPVADVVRAAAGLIVCRNEEPARCGMDLQGLKGIAGEDGAAQPARHAAILKGEVVDRPAKDAAEGMRAPLEVLDDGQVEGRIIRV